jgi:hypothetical protein
MDGAARWVWTLEVELAGVTRRVAEVDLAITSEALGELVFEAALEPVGFEEALDLIETDPAPTEVGVTFDFGPALPSVLAAGHDPRLAVGLLRLVPVRADGSALIVLERAPVVASGLLRSPAWGDPQRPTVIAATLTQLAAPSQAPLIPPSSVLSEDQFPAAEPSHHGKAFPFVFGRPGAIRSGGNLVKRPGSPVYYPVAAASAGAAPAVGLIAGHPVQASTVEVYVVETDTWEGGVPVILGSDLVREYREFLAERAAGREVSVSTAALYLASVSDAWQTDLSTVSAISVVDFSAMVAPPVGAEQAWVHWDTANALIGPDGAAVETAGDLLLYLLRAAQVPFDLARTRAVAEALTHTVAGYVNDTELTAWDYLQEVLLPLLPITLVNSPAGLYPVLLTPEALEGGATFFTWTEGEDVEALSPAQAEDNESPIAVRVPFGFDGLKGTYVAQAAAGPTGDSANGRSSSGWSKALASRGFGAGILEIEGAIIRDTATAHRIAIEALALRSWPVVHRTYAAPANVLLQLGDTGRITDAQVGWTSEPAMVMGREWDGGRWLYRLALRLRPRL